MILFSDFLQEGLSSVKQIQGSLHSKLCYSLTIPFSLRLRYGALEKSHSRTTRAHFQVLTPSQATRATRDRVYEDSVQGLKTPSQLLHPLGSLCQEESLGSNMSGNNVRV